MTEIEALRLISWVAILVGIGSLLSTVIPMMAANGTRPLLIAFSAMAVATFIGSLFLLSITYSIDSVNSTGLAEFGVFYLRFKPIIIGLILMWVGRRYWAARHQH